jgi:type IV pilus assembly protein PilA
MENPYTHAAATPSSSADDQRRSDYEAAIGPNSGYYLKYFEQFDAGESRAGWHWPAFFVGAWWCLYRKLWLPGILALVWPFILSFILGIAFAIIRPPPAAMIGVGALLLFAPYILLPIYANSIYWAHIRKLIERLPNSIAQVPDKRVARLERNGGTGVGPMIAVIVGGGFFFIFIIGILAAIAIPAYQDYTIRAQITEGINLAGVIKSQVAEYRAQHGAWPDQADLGHDIQAQGKYTSSVTVEQGSVVITYGGAANTNIKGQKLAILPGVTPAGDVVWACGYASLPKGLESGTGPSGSEVANKYLPKACREQ